MDAALRTDTIHAAKKYVVSSNTREGQRSGTPNSCAATSRPSLQQLKQQPGRGIGVGGVQLAMALTELGLIDEYQIVVHPRIVGRGPTLFAGLTQDGGPEARGPRGVRLRGGGDAV
jgi:dihydrofolate reductase